MVVGRGHGKGRVNRGQGVLEMGQLAVNKGPARMGIRHDGQRAEIPSKGIFLQ